MNNLSLEHVDPRKGVLVSGLENEFNEIITDSTYNSKKVNRFVPYRVKDYPAPVNEGDLGEFLVGADILTDSPGNWVVCEFMVKGGIWWVESNRVGNCQVVGGEVGSQKQPKSVRSENGRKTGPSNGVRSAKTNFDPYRSENGKKTAPLMNAHVNTQKQRSINGGSNAKPVVCLGTGTVYTSALEAARKTGICQGSISQSCRKGCRAGGFNWEFV